MSEPSDAGLWIVAVSIVATFFWILIFPHAADKHPSSAKKNCFKLFVLMRFCRSFAAVLLQQPMAGSQVTKVHRLHLQTWMSIA